MTNPTATDTPATPRDAEHPFRYGAGLADVIETRWQSQWDREETFAATNPGDDGFDASKPKFYCLDMFPYPSGAGLHVGHPLGYIGTDIVCRHKRMTGHNVLHPMGWDAFGLPAEQYAIQTGVHPEITTRKAIDNFRRQLKRLGFSYDWAREFATVDEDYYRWTQWIWLLAYSSWYDASADRARPIAELEAEFASGARPVRFDPERPAGLGGHDDDLGAWDALDVGTKKDVLDSYRLAYLATQTVNWCPKLGTVLANEEVIDGKSERGWHPVHRRPLKQWVFRITAYAERLLADLDLVKWPDSTVAMQKTWIGRSEGAEVDFALADDAPDGFDALRVFTTRHDTIFGATFMVVAPEHPLVAAVLERDGNDALRAYVEAAGAKSDVDRMAETKEKTGVATGVHAINPATGETIPVWTADYVLMGYGHGAIMAVPGHDQRDIDFANAFGLPIVQVIESDDATFSTTEATIFDGRAVNSSGAEFSIDGLPCDDAKAKTVEWLERTGRGTRKINYKIRDWLFSRQRYWGEPFPIVTTDDGRHWPVDADHLPVTLPPLDDYQPAESEDPTPLLGKATAWVETTAGEAGCSALPADTPVKRETNTMPGWAGSCWYYLRYCDPRNAGRFVSREAEQYWMVSTKDDGSPHAGGVDLYVGGAEHATLHLLYARFWHKILFDLGEVSTPEPFGRVFHQGLLTSFAYQRPDKSLVPVDEVEEKGENTFIETATGEAVAQVIAKMSKALRNVINPDDVIADYGADTFRLYEMYMGPLDASKPWNTRDIVGVFRFLQRVWRLVVDETTGELTLRADADDDVERALHKAIEKVGSDTERLAFNTAIAAMIEFVNTATSGGGLTADQLNRFARILCPYAPHMASELWNRLGGEGCCDMQSWPEHDPALLVEDTIELPVQVMGKVRGRVTVPADADEDTVREAALADANVQTALDGKDVKKVIYVPGRIVNVIA